MLTGRSQRGVAQQLELFWHLNWNTQNEPAAHTLSALTSRFMIGTGLFAVNAKGLISKGLYTSDPCKKKKRGGGEQGAHASPNQSAPPDPQIDQWAYL